MSRLKELGDDVSLKDLDNVQGEIMTKIETEEAEKALESIKTGFDLQSQAAPTSNYVSNPNSVDFNLDEILEHHQVVTKSKRKERSEIIDSEEIEDDDEDEEYSKEMEGFINDNSDNERKYENEPTSYSNSEAESEAEFSDPEVDKTTSNRRGITLNFSDDSETEQQQQQEPQQEPREREPKKRSIGRIMDSDDE